MINEEGTEFLGPFDAGLRVIIESQLLLYVTEERLVKWSGSGKSLLPSSRRRPITVR